jgi:hypothetical protein
VIIRVDTRLCDGGSGSNWLDRSSGSGRDRDRGAAVTVDLSLSAITRDVASLAAAVAGLASGVERATVGSSAVAGDVACKKSAEVLDS